MLIEIGGGAANTKPKPSEALPIWRGGTAETVNQIGTQRSGSNLERRNYGVNELSCLHGSERYGVNFDVGVSVSEPARKFVEFAKIQSTHIIYDAVVEHNIKH